MKIAYVTSQYKRKSFVVSLFVTFSIITGVFLLSFENHTIIQAKTGSVKNFKSNYVLHKGESKTFNTYKHYKITITAGKKNIKITKHAKTFQIKAKRTGITKINVKCKNHNPSEITFHCKSSTTKKLVGIQKKAYEIDKQFNDYLGKIKFNKKGLITDTTKVESVRKNFKAVISTNYSYMESNYPIFSSTNDYKKYTNDATINTYVDNLIKSNAFDTFDKINVYCTDSLSCFRYFKVSNEGISFIAKKPGKKIFYFENSKTHIISKVTYNIKGLPTKEKLSTMPTDAPKEQIEELQSKVQLIIKWWNGNYDISCNATRTIYLGTANRLLYKGHLVPDADNEHWEDIFIDQKFYAFRLNNLTDVGIVLFDYDNTFIDIHKTVYNTFYDFMIGKEKYVEFVYNDTEYWENHKY